MSTSRDAEIVIVGAGPAGAAAAFFLAAAGRDVVLVDRRRFPREKPCGEGVLPAGVGVLERIGVRSALEARGAQRFAGIRYHAPGGRAAVGFFPGGERGLGVRRRVLDDVLLGAVRATGRVRVEEDFHVRALLRDGRGAVSGVSDGAREIRSSLVIGADGARSRVRKLAGLEGAVPARWGMRQHFRPVSPPACDELVDVYVTGDVEAYVTPVAPGEWGVAWLSNTPAREDARVTAGAAPFARRAERAIRETLRGRGGIAERLVEAPASSEVLAAAGMGSVARSPIGDGVLLLGDAAGAPDPITGMGTSFALRCAEGLPQALEGAFARREFGREAMTPYLRLRRREVGGGFAVTRAVLWLASRRARAELAIRALDLAPPIFPTLFRLAAG